MFSTVHYFTRAEAWDDVRILDQGPASLPLQFEAVGADVTKEGDETSLTYHWQFSALAAKAEDVAAVAPIDRLPRLVVTSASSWEAIGRAYAALAEPKCAVTPRVQALADEITAGVDDRRQQAQTALHMGGASISATSPLARQRRRSSRMTRMPSSPTATAIARTTRCCSARC